MSKKVPLAGLESELFQLTAMALPNIHGIVATNQIFQGV
jgi:hypothetical protein